MLKQKHWKREQAENKHIEKENKQKHNLRGSESGVRTNPFRSQYASRFTSPAVAVQLILPSRPFVPCCDSSQLLTVIVAGRDIKEWL